MSNSPLTYEESFKIRSSEVDANQTATLPAICNLLQEVSGNHALELHFDITDLQQHKLTWVLHRLQLVIERFPAWRESVTIKTWPSGGDGLRAYRDFRIYDQKGNTIGRSLSHWLILDMESRKPHRIPEEIRNKVPAHSSHVLSPDEHTVTGFEKADASESFHVRKTDLDLNLHLNNVRYVEWAMASHQGKNKPDNIDIKFMAEASLGDTVTASFKSGGKQKYFQLKRHSDNRILALASSK
ncbi:acyl-[acyl-carrier-protein] thioesterase [Fodinibius sediminis]|uniref:Acyl-ACP thioesterase n=1 Tax=Fodinibius sediminis TaxID=1214077 RepID=A0A521F3H1_9BACT|nr:acyl-ACP thioesterase domain-containing protein [Fodinibius sediminis]SMO90576.1 Acyl-ACP thioesterase [Fodinibius sediminis]